MRKIIYILFAFFGLSSTVQAQVSSNAFKINCIPELGYLSIAKNSYEGSFIKQNFIRSWSEVYKKYGIMYIPSLIERTKDFDLIKIDSFNGSCQLGNKKFDIIITPIIGNKDECSGYYSMAVTVKLGEKLLVDNLLFQRCHYKDEYANEIFIEIDKSGYIDIRGYKDYHGWYGNEDFTPITDKTYYTKKWSWYGM